MKTKSYALGAAFALIATSALTFAAVDGLSVKRQPKEGQVVKLRIKAEIDVAGVTAVFTGLATQKVTKVETDGSYSQEENQVEGHAKFGDQDVDVPATPTATTIYNADGTVKEIRGEAEVTSSNAYRMDNLELVIDPGHPVNVGDTWTYDIKADTKTGAVAAKATYKLVSEENINGTDALKIQRTIKESGGADAASSDGNVWIDKSDGTLVKEETKLVNAPLPGAPSPVTATVTANREQ